jgi:hypothetical protein
MPAALPILAAVAQAAEAYGVAVALMRRSGKRMFERATW